MWPLSFLYAFAIFVRNRLFDWKVLPSEKGALPTIVLGNLSAGGTGKTPHTEYIINHLRKKYRPALLSRGYGRKTHGFILADQLSTASSIGDEPMQIHQKFLEIPLAVCEDRIAGVKHLKEKSQAAVVVLDDAFQHRRLIGDLNILLVDYNRPFWTDFPLPAGNLRDNVFEKRRANILLVTKCPENLDRVEKSRLIEKLSPHSEQAVFFTTYIYSEPVQIHGKKTEIKAGQQVAGFSGIAHSEPFKQYLADQYELVSFRSFTDHHIFSHPEVNDLWNECGRFASPEMLLITTEKDATKLNEIQSLKDIPIFYIPIEIRFLADEEKFLLLLEQKVPKATN